MINPGSALQDLQEGTRCLKHKRIFFFTDEEHLLHLQGEDVLLKEMHLQRKNCSGKDGIPVARSHQGWFVEFQADAVSDIMELSATGSKQKPEAGLGRERGTISDR